MKLTGAEFTIRFLETKGIKILSGIPGGAILPIYDALGKSNIHHILARHEQGAGFIAHGMARSTGKTAVCFATSGPGATNFITAIADAKMDSIPVLFITGQVPLSLIGTDAFQEIPITELANKIVKKAFLVKSIESLPEILEEAYILTTSNRPGPVLVDIPKDIQMQIYDFPIARKFEFNKNQNSTGENQNMNYKLTELIQTILESKKPLILAGGGIIQSNSSEKLIRFIEKNKIPVINTLHGLGSIPSNHPLNLGMLGMHGWIETNKIVEEADCILALGLRFDDRVTGKVSEFCKNAKIIHVELDPKEMGKIILPYIPVPMDLNEFFNYILKIDFKTNHEDWLEFVSIKRNLIESEKRKNPLYDLFLNLSKNAKEDTIITTDVGQHQMWTAQLYPFEKPRSFLTSGGLGTMGFGLPAAIGAGLIYPNRDIVCITGDGSIMMNIQELAVVKEENLNIKIILFNNRNLGLVRQQQDLFYNKNYKSSRFTHETDFVSIAKAFGIQAFKLEDSSDSKSIIEKIFQLKGPMFLEILISENEFVFPMVPPGKGNLSAIGVRN